MHKAQHKAQQGFTLIELMIVIAIIGILAAIAIPQYVQYTQQANATAAVTEAATYKTSIALCTQTHGGSLSACDAGNAGIPTAAGAVTGVSDGVITVNLGDIDGDNTNDTVTLTPTVAPTGITWTIQSNSGTDACAQGWLDC